MGGGVRFRFGASPKRGRLVRMDGVARIPGGRNRGSAIEAGQLLLLLSLARGLLEATGYEGSSPQLAGNAHGFGRKGSGCGPRTKGRE